MRRASAATNSHYIDVSDQTQRWIDDVLSNEEILRHISDCVNQIEEIVDSDFELLLDACQEDDVGEVRRILSKSEFHEPLVNRSMASGATLVWTATCANSTKCVVALVDHKAKPFTHNELGFSPLHVACELGNTRIVQKLLEAIVSDEDVLQRDQAEVIINRVTGSNTFPLFNAAKNGHAQIVKLLLSAKARVNCLVLPEGITALHTAKENGHKNVVKILLDAGAEDLGVPVQVEEPPLSAAPPETENCDSDHSHNGQPAAGLRNNPGDVVTVIKHEILLKRINWSSEFHGRYFRLLKVGPEAHMPNAKPRFFIEYYRDRSMSDLRECLEIDAESSVAVWANPKVRNAQHVKETSRIVNLNRHFSVVATRPVLREMD